MSELPILTHDALRAAMAGSAPAFRLRLELEPAGGDGSKVFPPTYEGGSYAKEARRIKGQTVDCVLLDSVQSQANRMELALLRAWEDGEIELPVISTNFEAVNHPGFKRVTSLEAPHRIADALLRDSLLGKDRFRNSAVGKKLDQVSIHYATPLFEHCPTALVFGMWDSTGPRGGLGIKFARAMVSEIVGINAIEGKKTTSRIDPTNIKVNAGTVYRTKDGWTLDEKEALKEKNKPVKVGNGKPSEINHGNITPSIQTGSFTIDRAEQVTVLSLAALRRLRFPLGPKERSKPEVDLAARTYLAALGLTAAALMVESGEDLRSRCQLHAFEAPSWELLGKPGEPTTSYLLPGDTAIALAKQALAACDQVGLPYCREEVELTPMPDLLTLVRRSIELAAVEGGQD